MPGTVQEVADVLDVPQELPRWWPEVYLSVARLVPGGEHNVGGVFDFRTRGWLPYTLRWQMTVESVVPNRRFVIRADGDFIGTGVWTLTQDGPNARVTYEWTIRVGKPLLRRLSFALRPIFSANHRWAMRAGERGLARELERRRVEQACARGVALETAPDGA